MKTVVVMSRTNVVLDDKLIKEALSLTRLKTKRDVVHYALQELVRKKKRKGLLKLEGKLTCPSYTRIEILT
jgi:Arc/MetJ family transcription regulator